MAYIELLGADGVPRIAQGLAVSAAGLLSCLPILSEVHMRAGQRRCSRGRANRRRRTASARRNPAPPRPTRRLLMLWKPSGPSSPPCPVHWRRLAGTALWKTILGRPSSRRHRPGLRTGSCEPTVSASGEQSGRISRSRQTCRGAPACTNRSLLGRVLLPRERHRPKNLFSAALRKRESRGR